MRRSNCLIATWTPLTRLCNSPRAVFRAASLPGKTWTWPPRSSNRRVPRTLTLPPLVINLSTPLRSSSDSRLPRLALTPLRYRPFLRCPLQAFHPNCWNGAPILPRRKEELPPPTNKLESPARLFSRQLLWGSWEDSRAGDFQIG